jgi:hypothetical protein
MFKKKNLAVRFHDAPQFFQAQNRIRHRTKYKRCSPLFSKKQHFISYINAGNIGIFGIIRKILARANTCLKNPAFCILSGSLPPHTPI